MKLTPIKVPGKVNIDKSKAAIAARKALKRAPGRPLHVANKKRSLEQEDPSSAKRPRKNPSGKKMSALESLPVEILASIFLYCMDFDFPRCSPVITRKLSSPAIYKRTVIAAFGPIWNLWHGHSDHFPPKTSEANISEDSSLVIHDRPGDHVLEARVLRCRWATAELLTDAKELWIQRNALNRPFVPLLFMEKPQGAHIALSEYAVSLAGTSSKAQLPEVGMTTMDPGNTRELESAEHPHTENSDMCRRMTMRELFAKDYDQFCRAVEQDEVTIALTSNWDKYNDIHYRTEIPSSLLAGPWTEEMVRKLFWLVRGGACIQRTAGSTDSEAAREGFNRAIEEGNLRVLHLFDWMNAVRLPSLVNAIRTAGRAREGCNKVAIVNRVLHHGYVEDRLNPANLDYLKLQLKVMKDECYRNKDDALLALIEGVCQLPEIRRLNILSRSRP